MRQMAVAILAATLAGCADDVREIGLEPAMTPVGTGLIPSVQPSASALFLPARAAGQQSAIWDGRRANIFGDVRAVKIGDVITVQIAIDDKATFGNASERSLNSQINTGFDFKLNWLGKTTEYQPRYTSSSTSSTAGQGAIDRSGKIQLAVAAIVTDVLPNGNLIISGSQEVRVNLNCVC
jgi:flagellar L-ring protein precursor FlgH